MSPRYMQLGLSDPLPAEPPREFRIFHKGWNDTSKGKVLFDDEAAALVLAAWRRWGVRLMIDLNHDSLDASSMSREDASDARGWVDLEVRDGGLWAVNVEWTADGDRRIRERLQRYISPALLSDEDGRVTEILNIALVSMPATYQPQDLIAARRLSARLGGEPVTQLGAVNGEQIVQASGKFWALADCENDEPREVVPVYVSRQLAARIRAARFLEKAKHGS